MDSEETGHHPHEGSPHGGDSGAVTEPAPLHPAVEVVVRDLLAQCDNDMAAALWVAASTIVELSSTTSYGYIRTVPYKEVMPPKPRAPSL